MKKIAQIIKILKKKYPHPKTALNFDSGDKFQLLAAVILSAQCTDERVNRVTPALFKRFPKVSDYAECEISELEKLIYSTGFYKNKARNIKGAAKRIAADFKGKVPDNMVDLLKLPGVARKTANVILYAGFGKNEGIVVDTHVCRVSGKLGLVSLKLSNSKNAVKIEQELMKIIPKKEWGGFSMRMVLHGRQICVARKPGCGRCPLNKVCPSANI